MQYITHHYLFQKRFQKRYQKQLQKRQSTAAHNKWLLRAYTTGFIFFLVKGLAWIIAAVWFIY